MSPMALTCSTPRVRDARLVWLRSVFGSKKRAILRCLTGLHTTREQYGPLIERCGELAITVRGERASVRRRYERSECHGFGSESHTHDVE
jgi:hypothetical protein